MLLSSDAPCFVEVKPRPPTNNSKLLMCMQGIKSQYIGHHIPILHVLVLLSTCLNISKSIA